MWTDNEPSGYCNVSNINQCEEITLTGGNHHERKELWTLTADIALGSWKRGREKKKKLISHP